MSEEESKARKREELTRIHINEVLKRTFEGISQLSEEAAETVLESTCRACVERALAFMAHNYGYDPERPDLDALMVADEKLENIYAQGQASVTKEGNTITWISKTGGCSCTLVKDYGVVRAFPNLCLCSKNFVKALYGAAAKRPVRVEIVESYIRGGDRCHFRIELL